MKIQIKQKVFVMLNHSHLALVLMLSREKIFNLKTETYS